ncbi:hypothetical protein BASA81_006422 [Batrachochytrium salamandrivorans]|nr:hypothetical protein BASA81_006422 [Batrachochytrium salamandrivorans]
MVCKSCDNPHRKWCCPNYDRVNRTSKQYFEDMYMMKERVGGGLGDEPQFARRAVFEQRPTHPRRVPSVDGFGGVHKHGRAQRHEGLLARAFQIRPPRSERYVRVYLWWTYAIASCCRGGLVHGAKGVAQQGDAHARFANLLVNYCDEQGTVQKKFQGGAFV